jgi:multiple sugar transport system ATP-binding protein
MARVVLDNLSKAFRDAKGHPITAVQNLSLTVNDRELLVLVGPSGCGKTTTLRLIAGLEDPSGGSVSLDDRNLNKVEPKDRDVAMVFQNHALYPHMSARENLASGMIWRKFPRDEIEKRVDEVAGLLSITECLERKPDAISGGQRQRVALGRALVLRPKLFLLDEPLASLDAPTRVQMRREIARLQHNLGITMIYVTHDQVEAMTLGHRIAVMKDGAIQQLAAPLELYRAPANLFVAGFIGSPAMNFFPGKLSAQDGKVIFIATPPCPIAMSVAISHIEKLAPFAGREITLGLRPSDIHGRAKTGDTGNSNLIEGVVEVVEPLGVETHLCISDGGSQSFVARLDGRETVKADERIRLWFDMEQAHFFEPKTGKRV